MRVSSFRRCVPADSVKLCQFLICTSPIQVCSSIVAGVCAWLSAPLNANANVFELCHRQQGLMLCSGKLTVAANAWRMQYHPDASEMSIFGWLKLAMQSSQSKDKVSNYHYRFKQHGDTRRCKSM